MVMESKMLLPFCVVVAAAALYLAGVVEGGWWIQTACLAVSVMLIGELSSSNQLLRVVSQSTPSMYLLLVAVAIYLFPDNPCFCCAAAGRCMKPLCWSSFALLP